MAHKPRFDDFDGANMEVGKWRRTMWLRVVAAANREPLPVEQGKPQPLDGRFLHLDPCEVGSRLPLLLSTSEPVGIRPQHLCPRPTVLPIKVRFRGGGFSNLNCKHMSTGQNWFQRVARESPQTAVLVHVSRNGDTSRFHDLSDHLDDRRIRRSLALASFALVFDSAEQPVDVRGRLVRIENCEHMRVPIGCYLDPWKQVQRSKLGMLAVAQLSESLFQLVHPIARIVIGYGHAVDTCTHEAKKPVVRRYIVIPKVT